MIVFYHAINLFAGRYFFLISVEWANYFQKIFKNTEYVQTNQLIIQSWLQLLAAIKFQYMM